MLLVGGNVVPVGGSLTITKYIVEWAATPQPGAYVVSLGSQTFDFQADAQAFGLEKRNAGFLVRINRQELDRGYWSLPHRPASPDLQ